MLNSIVNEAVGVEKSCEVVGNARLKSCFSVSELASAAIGSVGLAVSELLSTLGLATTTPGVVVDRRLASLWMGFSIEPIGWDLPPTWDEVSGDYPTRDGWVRLHANAPHHKAAVLGALDCEEDRSVVAEVIRTASGDEIETAVVEAGGAAACMRSREEWKCHPQGLAVAQEPLVHWDAARKGALADWTPTRERPLSGLRVLDLTRILAGPVATRTLAALGATVLRIDPIDWDEPVVAPEVTVGKRCAKLDLKRDADRDVFESLLMSAHVFVHGYRPEALERLGFGRAYRAERGSTRLEVSLDAYGWTGPWRNRRGFDSLVQMSSGIAAAGMDWQSSDRPVPLPVQALDQATGYLMAASVISALRSSACGDGLLDARLSLARTAELLCDHPQLEDGNLDPTPSPADLSPAIERTSWGDAKRLRPPIAIEGTPMQWDSPATELGSSAPVWQLDDER